MRSDVEECQRHKVKLRDGQNFYFIMGKDFIQCCPPYENRPENAEMRMLLDDFCSAVSVALKKKQTIKKATTD